MCCAKKRLAKLEAEIAELKAALNRLSEATIGRPAIALPPAVPISAPLPRPKPSPFENRG